MSDAWLIVGLGNPGPQYAKTRHNIGQMVLDKIAREMGSTFKKHSKASAVVVEGRLGIGGPKVVLMKSLGYMNTSGGPVSAVAKFYGIDPDHIIVVHDELDIPFDTIKLKIGGEKAATTACAILPRRWAPKTITVCALASVAHPGA